PSPWKPTRKARLPCCRTRAVLKAKAAVKVAALAAASVAAADVTAAASAVAVAKAVAAASVARAVRAETGIVGALIPGVRSVRLKRRRENSHESSQAFLPAPQELPVHRQQRAQDRLQGHPVAVALHLGARQDRAVPHHGRVGQEARRTGPRHQARALP